MTLLAGHLHFAHNLHEPAVALMHAYPSEHGSHAAESHRVIRDSRVLLVEMEHTHYNELANDGRMIYAATRSTGQIEEGPAGLSATTPVDGVVSWKFNPDPSPMPQLDAFTWGRRWDPAQFEDGPHELAISAKEASGQTGSGRVVICVNRSGDYEPPARREAEYENVIGAWAEKHILGTQLGPNENGHAWPPRRERWGATH